MRKLINGGGPNKNGGSEKFSKINKRGGLLLGTLEYTFLRIEIGNPLVLCVNVYPRKIDVFNKNVLRIFEAHLSGKYAHVEPRLEKSPFL